MKLPRTWLLLGPRRGDNGQLLALAEALGTPFETRTITYKRSTGVRMKLMPGRLGHITPESFKWLQPPWPDLVFGIGRRSVPLARWIQAQSGGRTRLVRLGHPRAPNELFDLIITTPQYPVPPGDNVLKLPLAMNRFREVPKPRAEENAWLAARPRPHLLLSLGGPSAMWQLDLDALGAAVRSLVSRADNAGGTLLVVGSPRTPPDAWATVSEAGGGSASISLIGKKVRYPVLLADADEQFVTADSVSMISEAIMSGKPVGLIPVQPDAKGKRQISGKAPDETEVRDPRRFWAEVQERGLVGTFEEPLRGSWEDPVELAVRTLRERLSGLFE